MSDQRGQRRRAVLGLGVVVAGLAVLLGALAVVGDGRDRVAAAVGLLIVLLGGLLLALLVIRPRPAGWQPSETLRLRARAGFEVPMRALVVLSVLLGVVVGLSVPAEIGEPGPASATGVLARLALALGALCALPVLVRMLAGRLPWMTLELGPRLVYRGWRRSADLAWGDIDAIEQHPTAERDIVVRHGRGEELLIHASLFPGAWDELLDELRRRRALAGRR
ncbi:hypothetical protein [Nocardioides nitrophenolicus]|uniref:hypothetical protein n=1 Tax=Nocardioides nitrophenolicus TaxID=60489 RepID=UPI001958CE1D|nr:hypothetical protein [Nocardioides nitrophenolicus]MBM7516442.1 protein-S-isoprenylcysteine O-methyltransferase Ste14 [Nocardioides nitrophenolicus]